MRVLVFTAGYEGHSVETFVQHLRAHGVKVVVDVRELPLSRKKGFSKTPLSEALRDSGIAYVHLRELGTPRELRDALRQSGDYPQFFRSYEQHLARYPAAVEKLAELAREGPVCLVCFEKDPAHCHRSVLAAKLQARGFAIRHI